MAGSQDGATGPYDLLLLMDATASMGTFVDALNKSLQEVISISALTACFERIGVLAYRDYCGGELTEWSGWCSPSGAVQAQEIVSQDDVLNMAKGIRPDAGGDWPEATKTGLARAYSLMRADATTIVLLYADAPPHFKETDGPNYHREMKELKANKKYGDTDSLFVDWTSAAKTLESGPKKAVVFSMIQKISVNAHSPYLYLSTVTGGNLFEIGVMNSDYISQLTLGVLLTWMRLGEAVADSKTVLAYLTRYKSVADLNNVKHEEDKLLDKFIGKGHFHDAPSVIATGANTMSEQVTAGIMHTLIKARGPKIGSFAERYTQDPSYKALAVDQLKRVIETNVSAVSVNPIFGSLWRAVCNDRTNPARDQLLQMFSLNVERISDIVEKTRMKAWLAESYNYADEIDDLIMTVPAEYRYPFLFLDPTAEFGTAADEDGEEDGSDKRRLQDFTRPELLEIGRSCDYKILRRLGKVLTRLTFVQSTEELPHHIRTMEDKEVPCIPLALADGKYNHQFWKVMLHAVLPGTKLGARPAALLAALSLRMGITALRDVADEELVSFSDKWNSIDIPETWNLGCLNLLLDADKDYERRIADGVTTRATPESRILSVRDKDTFKALVDYKMLELNLETALKANIGWSPHKSKVPLGPMVICKKCAFPRSVTIMAPGGICGICDLEGKKCGCPTCCMTDDHADRLQTNVAADDNEKSIAHWVECSQTSCRAQYVVYNTDQLRVRAKCYFCRHMNKAGQAPLVECHKCLSRIIWPDEYRPEDLDLSKYECPACLSGKETIVAEDTCAKKLSEENGWEWLLKNQGKVIHEPFNGRTVFYTASHCDLAKLASNLEILPTTNSDFTIRGKLVRNSADVRTALLNWVRSRRAESGTCSLCFSNFRKADLNNACGRSGCHQAICNGCRKDWYGLNAPGRIINIAALRCPFCRRQPAPKSITQFGIHNIGDLRSAIEESGSWIYAWCNTCGYARQYVERVCAAGAPPELTAWSCGPCEPVLESKKFRVASCPGCGVVTQKTYGCDHITCPCGTHWCYACGKNTGEQEIYTHMDEEHGGLGWGDISEREDDYDDDDDDDAY